MTETITRFKMGEDIPEWLLALEPRPDAPSQRGNFRFAVDVDVVDTPDIYYVLPVTPGNFPGVFDWSGTNGCLVSAAAKTVKVATATTDFFIPTDPRAQWTPASIANGPPQIANAWGDRIEITRRDNPLTEALKRSQERAAAEMLDPTLRVPDPQPTFWARLLYVLRGR